MGGAAAATAAVTCVGVTLPLCRTMRYTGLDENPEELVEVFELRLLAVEQGLPEHVAAEGFELAVAAGHELHEALHEGRRVLRRVAVDL